MARKYVELNRKFVEFGTGPVSEPDSLSHGLTSYLRSKTWEEVLTNRCTVVVAEAGSGKTVELRHQTERLRRAGQSAFFCRLDLLATMPFDRAIEMGTATEFNNWQNAETRGYFFLDSVDEAKLANPQDFERAVIRFIEAVEHYKSRATIVISTRPHAWQGFGDRDMLDRRLRLPPGPGITASSNEDDDGSVVNDFANAAMALAPSRVDSSSDKKETSSIIVLRLLQLDEEQIRRFADAYGVTDLDDFIDAIEYAEADVFATRPEDLSGLIDLWQKQKRIGRYSDVVANNIRLKLSETNTTHQHAATIAADRAMEGAQALAAAVTLCQRTSILLPDQPINGSLRDLSLNPEEILKKWTPAEVNVLLGRALFDESLYGTVRFHHRSAREYLAARWFERLLQQRKSRREVEKLLFAKPYGTEPEIVVPSMKPIVGWLSAWDQRIRDKALRIDQKVLLEFGDTSALDIGTRESLLREFAKRYESQKYTPLSLHTREVRRLADPKLSSAIRSLLSTYRDHNDVRQLLLRIVQQGRIPDCGASAMTFALDDAMDSYTRACAIQAIGIAGTINQKKALAKVVTAAPNELDREVIAAAVDAFWPDVLSDEDIISILEKVEPSKPFSSDSLDLQLKRLANNMPPGRRSLVMLHSFVSLLQTPPLHNDEYCGISIRNDWLLSPAWNLAQGLLKSNCIFDFDPAILTMLSIIGQADHLDRYTGDIHNEATEIIRSNRQLMYALFWHEIGQARSRAKRPIIDWWQTGRPMPIPLDETQIVHFCDAIQHRPLLDDKLVALSCLITIYGHSNRQSVVLNRIEEVVKGESALERALQEHLTPKQLSPELTEARTKSEPARKRNETKKVDARKSREVWIAKTRADPTNVGDLAIAADGKVWNNTIWLFDEVRTKQSQSTRWTIGEWELLEPDFGPEVAVNFRNFCQSFWRLYKPQLRSEGVSQSTSTPWAVIVGLSGIAMEARASDAWASRLTSEEAALAVRYALWEMNDLPNWLYSLYQARSTEVTRTLLGEIQWEFQRKRVNGTPGYVLSRLRWTAKELGHVLRPDLMSVVEKCPNAEINALTEALTVILRDPAPVTCSFHQLVAKHAGEATDDEYKALWLSVLLCLDACTAIGALETWGNAGESREIGERRMSTVLTHLWGDNLHSLNSQHQDFKKPEVLRRLIVLAYRHVSIQHDIHHDEAYSPDLRDHAQGVRDQLIQILYSIPGRATYEALRSLPISDASEFLRDRMLVLAERRAEADTEHFAWSAVDVAGFAEDTECNPTTQNALFKIGLYRLDDLRLELEEGDESEATLLRKAVDEIEMRRAIANRLRQVAQGKYTTGSEEELADATRSDIRLHNPAVEARIPIEIKIAGQWSANVLRERLENQLVRQYMKEAHYGVFLLVNRGANVDRKTWKHSNKTCGFFELVEWLGGQARGLAISYSIGGLEVVGINLVRRDQDAVNRKSSSGRWSVKRGPVPAKRRPGSRSRRPEKVRKKR
jgi:hypothetical protein